MKTTQLGKSSLQVSVLGYGCWRLASTNDPEHVTPERRATGRAAVLAAYEAGYTLFDHADIYCRGEAETIFGEVLREVSGMRDRILIATKCGIRAAGDPDASAPYRYDFSAQHIVASCEQSLRRLGIEVIDVYLLHRPDFLCDPAEVATAFGKLKKAGKVREFGVSNFLPSFVSTLQAFLPFPIVANQVEIHPGRLDCFTDGTLDQCLREQITPLAWSPLGGGAFGAGREVKNNHGRYERYTLINQALDATARDYGVSRTVIALAWLLKHPSRIVPIIGSNNPDNIRDSAKADNIDLTREQWYRILLAARGNPLP